MPRPDRGTAPPQLSAPQRDVQVRDQLGAALHADDRLHAARQHEVRRVHQLLAADVAEPEDGRLGEHHGARVQRQAGVLERREHHDAPAAQSRLPTVATRSTTNVGGRPGRSGCRPGRSRPSGPASRPAPPAPRACRRARRGRSPVHRTAAPPALGARRRRPRSRPSGRPGAPAPARTRGGGWRRCRRRRSPPPGRARRAPRRGRARAAPFKARTRRQRRRRRSQPAGRTATRGRSRTQRRDPNQPPRPVNNLSGRYS